MEKENFYERLKSVSDKRKLAAFYTGFERGLIYDLDIAWASGDRIKYDHMLENIKACGIRVYRNSQGKHKIKTY